MNALPAFVRALSTYVLTNLVGISGRTEVTLDDVHRLFREYYHSTPEPLPSWALLSIKGPLDFAIANHPDAAGGYSNSALVLPGEANTIANLSHTDHLYLLNHGYKAGISYITSDFGKWVRNLGRKLANFSDGFTLGYTARNLPAGPYGERRAVDLTTIYPRPALWEIVVLGLFGAGIVIAARRRVGGLWLLVIAGKLFIALVFYGYARQAVSVFPAFALFLALPLDDVIQWLQTKSGIGQRPRFALATSIVAVLIVTDLVANNAPPPSSIDGPLHATPQWGPTAFECSERILIKPVPSSE